MTLGKPGLCAVELTVAIGSGSVEAEARQSELNVCRRFGCPK